MTAFLLPNPLGVLVAAFATALLGWLWFERLFGRAHAAVLGRAYPPAAKPALLFVAEPALCMVVVTLALGVLMGRLGVETPGEAVGLGLLVGVGFLGSTAVNMGLNPNIPRPLPYGFLSASHFALASVLVCVIFHAVG